MAKAIVKASTKSYGKMAQENFAGIPAKEQKLVYVRYALALASGEKITVRQMYEQMKIESQVEKDNQAAAAKLRDAENAKQRREKALEDLSESFNSLATVRDMAYALERDHEFASYMDTQSYAKLMRLSMVDAGRTLEKALDTLGVLKCQKAPYFLENAPAKQQQSGQEG